MLVGFSQTVARKQGHDEGFSAVMSEHARSLSTGIVLISLGHGITHQHEMSAPQATPIPEPPY